MWPLEILPQARYENMREMLSKLEDIYKAFVMPQKLINLEIKTFQTALSDKIFWLALADIHSFTTGRLKDWKEEEILEEDLFEEDVEGGC